MDTLRIISIAQIVVSVFLVVFVLLQQRGGGLGSAFGGAGTSFHTKRGAEKILFILTVVFAILFVLLTVLSLILR